MKLSWSDDLQRDRAKLLGYLDNWRLPRLISRPFAEMLLLLTALGQGVATLLITSGLFLLIYDHCPFTPSGVLIASALAVPMILGLAVGIDAAIQTSRGLRADRLVIDQLCIALLGAGVSICFIVARLVGYGPY